MSDFVLFDSGTNPSVAVDCSQTSKKNCSTVNMVSVVQFSFNFNQIVYNSSTFNVDSVGEHISLTSNSSP